MRIGYGYGRSLAAIEACNVERVYIDGQKTNREERRHLFRDLRSGDTLVLIAISDLGAGKGLRNMRAELEERGVSIEIVTPVKPEPPKPVGRPRAWSLPEEQEDRLRNMWNDVSVDGGHILDTACRLLGEDASDIKARERTRQRLRRKFGPRR